MKTERELFEMEAERLGIQLDKWEDGTYVNKNTYMFLSIWQASAQRKGYKLVPVEKLIDCLSEISDRSYIDDNVSEIKAMIGAAP